MSVTEMTREETAAIERRVRRKTVTITHRTVCKILAAAGNGQKIPQLFKGLPVGTEVLFFGRDERSHLYVMTLYHPSFGIVPDGEECERLGVIDVNW